MNILVNGASLATPLTGIGQYVRHLFSAMAQRPEVRLHYLLGRRLGLALPEPAVAVPGAARFYRRLASRVPGMRQVKRWHDVYGMWRCQSCIPWPCLYHEPNFLPLPFPGPTVVTVHDLSCFDLPESHPIDRVRFLQRQLPPSLARADQIITISRFSAARIRDCLGIPEERITVTPLAAGGHFRPLSEVEQGPVLSAQGLRAGGYVLSVGTIEPRKNLGTLIAAYARLPGILRRRFPLVLVGMQGWQTDSVMQAAAALVARGELRFLGYVPDKLMPALYSGAAAFVYPSRYEGFGLPPLEAMACGAPVIASATTSIPEVVADAGVLLDPDDVVGYSDALRSVLEDRGRARELGASGLARAGEFSWEKCAAATVAVYADAMARRGLS